MSSVPSWRHYYEKAINEKHPLIIYYPTCGGGDECITACPYGDKIWGHTLMRVKLFGFNEKPRLRPIMINPDLCKGCLLCVEACPTGALAPRDKPLKHPWLRLLIKAAKLPFKKRYGLRYVFRKEHINRFKKNNKPNM